MTSTADALIHFFAYATGSLFMGAGAIYFKRRFIDCGDRVMLDSLMSERALAFRNRGFVVVFMFFALVLAIGSVTSLFRFLISLFENST